MNRWKPTVTQRIRIKVGRWLIRLGDRIMPNILALTIEHYVPDLCDNWYAETPVLKMILDEAQRMPQTEGENQ